MGKILERHRHVGKTLERHRHVGRILERHRHVGKSLETDRWVKHGERHVGHRCDRQIRLNAGHQHAGVFMHAIPVSFASNLKLFVCRRANC